MKNKTSKINVSSWLVIAVLGLAVVVGSGISIVRAMAGDNAKVIVYGDYIEAAQQSMEAVGDAILGATGTRFPNGLSADTTSPNPGEVRGTTITSTGTTTVKYVAYSSPFKTSLTFTAGATTTPGGLFAIQNTGEDQICTSIVVDVDTADAVGGATGIGASLNYVVSTSTSASAYSGSGGNLIASTTNATGTDAIITNTSFPGTGTSAGESFIWSNGVYILGAFDDAARVNPGGTIGTYASSTAYDGQAGNVYLDCHSR